MWLVDISDNVNILFERVKSYKSNEGQYKILYEKLENDILIEFKQFKLYNGTSYECIFKTD